MRRSLGTVLVCCASAFVALLSACTTGHVAVGETNKTGQELKRRSDGGATGNGSSCSWEGTAGYAASNPAGQGSYAVGATFNALDTCNECSCTAQGIMCTIRVCETPKACSEEARLCPDGSYVARTGPNCEFSPCPGGGTICPDDARKCPDGSTSVRSGPSCEFTACPTPVACTDDAKQCPDGSYVGRTGPNCEFLCPSPCTKEECGPAMGMPNYLCSDGVTMAGPVCRRTNGKCGYTVVSCPGGGGIACPADAKLCPDGSFVSRTGPNCEFAPCP